MYVHMPTSWVMEIIQGITTTTNMDIEKTEKSADYAERGGGGETKERDKTDSHTSSWEIQLHDSGVYCQKRERYVYMHFPPHVRDTSDYHHV